MKNLRIGIPRALLYYSYAESWKLSFSELGLDVITSPETHANILREGIKHAVGDLCLPVKTFLGHAALLKDSVDLLFIPRYVSVEKESFMCPKMIGLPDVVRACFTNLPGIIDPLFHVKQFGDNAVREFTKPIAKAISQHHPDVYTLFKRNMNTAVEIPAEQNRVSARLLSEVGILSSHRKMNIGIVGRPYLLFDRHLSKNLFKYIKDLGANPIYLKPEEPDMREAMAVIPKWVYWDMGKEVVTSAHLFFKDDRVDGVINVCSSTCGPDSFTGDLIRKRLNQRNKPYMALSIDEHASDVGIQTRIEAFMDMIARVTA
ncbi:MAG: 2-hydroxyacyl-CoA dehydratase [Nitrospirae bacterium]|nr:2-hydroxyacyl-CoA dehydratase [Nitrospirota bacterium]